MPGSPPARPPARHRRGQARQPGAQGRDHGAGRQVSRTELNGQRAGDRRPLACGASGLPTFSQPAEDQAMARSAKPRVVGFNHVALEVGDIEEALAFWGRLFEFELRGKSDDMAPVDLGDQFIALQKGRKQAPGRRPPFRPGGRRRQGGGAPGGLKAAGVEYAARSVPRFPPTPGAIASRSWATTTSSSPRRPTCRARYAARAADQERERAQGACRKGHGGRVGRPSCRRRVEDTPRRSGSVQRILLRMDAFGSWSSVSCSPRTAEWIALSFTGARPGRDRPADGAQHPGRA